MWVHLLKRLGLDNMRMEISSIDYMLLLGFAMLMGAVQIILSYAASDIKDLLPQKGIFLASLSSGWLILGIALYFCASVFWIYMLSIVDIRLAYPIASTAVVFASIFQSFLDRSFPSVTYWIGVFVVLMGLALINYR